MARTFPTVGQSPIDAYSEAIDRPLVYVEATAIVTGKQAIRANTYYSATSGDFTANYFNSTYTGVGTGSVRALTGQVDMSATQTTQSGAQQLVGVHGRAKVSGTSYSSAAVVAGVMAQLLAGGTWTAINKAYCLWVDNQLATNPTAGTVAMIGIRQNNGVGTDVVDHVFDVYGAEIKQLFNFDGCISGGFITSSATAGTMTFTAKCFVDGVAAYMHLYNA